MESYICIRTDLPLDLKSNAEVAVSIRSCDSRCVGACQCTVRGTGEGGVEIYQPMSPTMYSMCRQVYCRYALAMRPI